MVEVMPTLLAVPAQLPPMVGGDAHNEKGRRRARELVERYGEDSLSPFILRPDKAFQFGHDGTGVLAYRVIGKTAVISGDPVAPAGQAAEVLAGFLELVRKNGWSVVVWGASGRHVEGYRRLGLHSLCLGEEAVVRPAEFSLDGRKVRKLRQSVNRLKRRGWEVTACDGRDLDASLNAEISALEAAWQATQPRVFGFVMTMGTWSPEVQPGDLYVLVRSPAGALRAMTRFAWHRGGLSLDVMRRLNQLPNGCSEAMICCALEIARARGVPEVSLNYAGLSHLLRPGSAAGPTTRLLARALARGLGRRFRLARLARFDAKFFPEWRPRFLVFGSWTGLPGAALRVLQAEGYLRERRLWPPPCSRPAARTPSGSPQADADR